MVTFYHNPRCRKSREALQLIQEKGVPLNIKLYLKDPPTVQELKEVLAKLDLRPVDLIRKQESLFRERYRDQQLTDDEWVDVMIAHPILIERPIAVGKDTAVVGRPPSKVTAIL